MNTAGCGDTVGPDPYRWDNNTIMSFRFSYTQAVMQAICWQGKQPQGVRDSE
jgi:hypothetical protein